MKTVCLHREQEETSSSVLLSVLINTNQLNQNVTPLIQAMVVLPL